MCTACGGRWHRLQGFWRLRRSLVYHRAGGVPVHFHVAARGQESGFLRSVYRRGDRFHLHDGVLAEPQLPVGLVADRC